MMLQNMLPQVITSSSFFYLDWRVLCRLGSVKLLKLLGQPAILYLLLETMRRVELRQFVYVAACNFLELPNFVKNLDRYLFEKVALASFAVEDVGDLRAVVFCSENTS